MDNIDFLPQRIRSQRARQCRLVRQAYLLGACALALMILGYYREDRISTAAAQLTQLNTCQSDLQKQAVRRTSLEQQMQDLMIMKQVEEHLGSRVSAQLVLVELQRRLPPGVVLTKLEMETLEVRDAKAPEKVSTARPVTGAAPAKTPAQKRVQLTITGLAPTEVDVANIIGQFSGSPLFESVDMGYTKKVEYKGHDAREFRATCYVAR